MTKTTTQTTVAQRLALAADRHGLWAKDAARFADIRAEFDLPESELTDAVIEEAHAIGRANMRLLQARIAARNEAIESKGTTVTAVIEGVKVEARVYKAEPKRRKTGTRALIFGHSVTAVLRWMGTQDWNWEDAALAVETLGGKKVADSTVRIQLNAGRKGERGTPAPITSSQAKQLRNAAK